MSYKTELINLVEESTAYLKSESAFYTTANKTALLSLINHAKCVIDGEYSVPFVRNREFAPVREGEDFLFATENFAMTPSYFMKNYGLKPAFEWYKSNHVMKKLKKQQKITENYAHEYNIKFDFDGLSGEILGKEIIKTLDEISKNRNKEFKNNDHNLFFKNSDKDAFVSKVKND
ncbi:MAG: hypothetical protein RR957_08505, partial [Oscillospiraceae bacterium]